MKKLAWVLGIFGVCFLMVLVFGSTYDANKWFTVYSLLTDSFSLRGRLLFWIYGLPIYLSAAFEIYLYDTTYSTLRFWFGQGVGMMNIAYYISVTLGFVALGFCSFFHFATLGYTIGKFLDKVKNKAPSA